MKINWKVRLRSKKFLLALAALGGLIATEYGIDAGSYETYVQATLLVLVTGGIVIDPTTPKLSDSERVLKKNKGVK